MQLGIIAIPKASSEARIRENLDVFRFSLSDRDMAALAELDRGHRTGSHPDNVH
jgi:diketogulonate reductase-like aldo/keto reductase